MMVSAECLKKFFEANKSTTIEIVIYQYNSWLARVYGPFGPITSKTYDHPDGAVLEAMTEYIRKAKESDRYLGLVPSNPLPSVSDRPSLEQFEVAPKFIAEAQGCNCGAPEGHVPGGIHCRRTT